MSFTSINNFLAQPLRDYVSQTNEKKQLFATSVFLNYTDIAIDASQE